MFDEGLSYEFRISTKSSLSRTFERKYVWWPTTKSVHTVVDTNVYFCSHRVFVWFHYCSSDDKQRVMEVHWSNLNDVWWLTCSSASEGMRFVEASSQKPLWTHLWTKSSLLSPRFHYWHNQMSDLINFKYFLSSWPCLNSKSEGGEINDKLATVRRRCECGIVQPARATVWQWGAGRLSYEWQVG